MPSSVEHVVVIGGTGMLAVATQYLGQHASAITVIACTPASLERLRPLFKGATAKLNLVPQDYNDKQGFSCTIAEAVRLHGVPEKVLAWVHNAAPAFELAEQLCNYGKPFSFFHVLGSESASPANDLATQRSAFDCLPDVEYHQIVLGFMPEGSGSRWLKDAEISAGVVSAIEAGAPAYVVGVVHPWSARP
jgi:hypothetical protein